MEHRSGMQTLDRGLRVMEYLASVNKLGASVVAISGNCGLARPVVYRILETLELRGYVERDHANRFRLGVRLLSLSASSLVANDLATVSLREMESMRDTTGASVRLFVRRGSDRICIQRLYGTDLNSLINIGDVLSLQRGASGQVILAFDDACPEAERQQADPALLKEVRARGWAVALNERDYGLGVIAAPILRAGVLQGAVSLALLLHRMDNGQYLNYVPILLEHTKRISEQLILL